MRHVNIPLFIPHLGCPNQCIFCNQHYISGTVSFNEGIIDEKIREVLRTVSSDDMCEIAFFGGSFTGIDRSLMVRLLDKAQSYVDSGFVSGIRMSTRPDYISEEILQILSSYTISCIELGIQTMNDNVLCILKRGHTSQDVYNAVSLLKEKGFSFAGQMMVGLPGASLEDEINCAKEICNLGAKECRIYPTIVFKNTELEQLTKNKLYFPLDIEEALNRSAEVLKIFVENGVRCLRIGLCDSENLHSEETYFDGPNYPSIGEMVKSRLFYKYIEQHLAKNEKKYNNLVIECALGATSQVVGNRKSNIVNLKSRFGIKSIKVIENSGLRQYDMIFREKEDAYAIKIT